MDEVHPIHSVMAEEVFGRSLKQPLHAFLDGLLHIHACFLVFLLCMRNMPLLDRWLIPPDKENADSDESPRCLFHKRMY